MVIVLQGCEIRQQHQHIVSIGQRFKCGWDQCHHQVRPNDHELENGVVVLLAHYSNHVQQRGNNNNTQSSTTHNNIIAIPTTAMTIL